MSSKQASLQDYWYEDRDVEPILLCSVETIRPTLPPWVRTTVLPPTAFEQQGEQRLALVIKAVLQQIRLEAKPAGAESHLYVVLAPIHTGGLWIALTLVIAADGGLLHALVSNSKVVTYIPPAVSKALAALFSAQAVCLVHQRQADDISCGPCMVTNLIHALTLVAAAYTKPVTSVTDPAAAACAKDLLCALRAAAVTCVAQAVGAVRLRDDQAAALRAHRGDVIADAFLSRQSDQGLLQKLASKLKLGAVNGYTHAQLLFIESAEQCLHGMGSKSDLSKSLRDAADLLNNPKKRATQRSEDFRQQLSALLVMHSNNELLIKFIALVFSKPVHSGAPTACAPQDTPAALVSDGLWRVEMSAVGALSTMTDSVLQQKLAVERYFNVAWQQLETSALAEFKAMQEAESNGVAHYSASGLKSTFHGNLFQLRVIMLALLNGRRLKLPILAATDWADAEKFDDAVFLDREKKRQCFIQAKHKEHAGARIHVDALTTLDASQPFPIIKYFHSYRSICRKPEFAASSGAVIREFAICTNAGITRESVDQLFDVHELDADSSLLAQLLYLPRLEPARSALRLTSRITQKRSELWALLKSSSLYQQVAQELVEHICSDTRIYAVGLFKNDVFPLAALRRVLHVKPDMRATFTKAFKDDPLDDAWSTLRGELLKAAENKGINLWDRSVEVTKTFKAVKAGAIDLPPNSVVTDHEVKSFFAAFALVADFPHQQDLDNPMQELMSCDFRLIDSSLMLGRLEQKLLDWFSHRYKKVHGKADQSRFFSCAEYNNLFTEMRSTVEGLALIGPTLEFRNLLEGESRLRLSFSSIAHNDFFERLKTFFTAGPSGGQHCTVVVEQADSSHVDVGLRLSCIHLTAWLCEKFSLKLDAFIFIRLGTARALVEVLINRLASADNAANIVVLVDHEHAAAQTQLQEITKAFDDQLRKNPEEGAAHRIVWVCPIKYRTLRDTHLKGVELSYSPFSYDDLTREARILLHRLPISFADKDLFLSNVLQQLHPEESSIHALFKFDGDSECFQQLLNACYSGENVHVPGDATLPLSSLEEATYQPRSFCAYNRVGIDCLLSKGLPTHTLLLIKAKFYEEVQEIYERLHVQLKKRGADDLMHLIRADSIASFKDKLNARHIKQQVFQEQHQKKNTSQRTGFPAPLCACVDELTADAIVYEFAAPHSPEAFDAIHELRFSAGETELVWCKSMPAFTVRNLLELRCPRPAAETAMHLVSEGCFQLRSHGVPNLLIADPGQGKSVLSKRGIQNLLQASFGGVFLCFRITAHTIRATGAPPPAADHNDFWSWCTDVMVQARSETGCLQLADCSNSFWRYLLRNLLRQRSSLATVVLVFDGFDELLKEDAAATLEALRFLAEQSCVLITARFSAQDLLERELCTMAYGLRDFDEAVQIKFLTAFFMYHGASLPGFAASKRGEDFPRQLLAHFKSAISDSQLSNFGNPLQARLFAEVALSHLERHLQAEALSGGVPSDDLPLPEVHHIADVYAMVVEAFYDRHLTKTAPRAMDAAVTDVQLPEMKRAWKLCAHLKHELLALELLAPEQYAEWIELERFPVLRNWMGNSLRDVSSIGLLWRSERITALGMHTKVRTLHRTFAEYFLALLISRVTIECDLTGNVGRTLYSFFAKELTTASWIVVATLLPGICTFSSSILAAQIFPAKSTDRFVVPITLKELSAAAGGDLRPRAEPKVETANDGGNLESLLNQLQSRHAASTSSPRAAIDDSRVRDNLFNLILERRFRDKDIWQKLVGNPSHRQYYLDKLKKTCVEILTADKLDEEAIEQVLLGLACTRGLLTVEIASQLADLLHQTYGEWAIDYCTSLTTTLIYPLLQAFAESFDRVEIDQGIKGVDACPLEIWQRSLPDVDLSAFVCLLVIVLEYISFHEIYAGDYLGQLSKCIQLNRAFTLALQQNANALPCDLALLARLWCVLARLTDSSLVFDQPSAGLWLVGRTDSLRVDLAICGKHRLRISALLVEWTQQRAHFDNWKDAPRLAELATITSQIARAEGLDTPCQSHLWEAPDHHPLRPRLTKPERVSDSEASGEDQDYPRSPAQPRAAKRRRVAT
ncbi:hypothetical protein HDU86_007516 [Geranomyces michiganensis]|nr:hypothetical protein HDU86_007516 [Geranomyces michiganensis]